MEDTILALATPPIKSALAVIRVSGDKSIDLTSKLFSKSLEFEGKNSILMGYLKNKEGKIIDQVVLLVYKAPNSFTGENVVEIICHGSQLIVEEVINEYLRNGARLARRGEFSQRAFLNNKMDLVETESINDLINASTKEGKDLALLSLKGESSKLLLPIKKKIEDLLAMIEVNIDFPEFKDVEEATPLTIKKFVDEINQSIDCLIKDGLEGKIIKEGISVSLIGEPNVGKSSLLNALLGEQKAIVTNIPGTTRDVVEGVININGIPVKLLDTAGVRETNNEIEKIGVELSEKTINEADLVIYCLDSSSDSSSPKINELIKDKKVIYCFNKSDLVENKDPSRIYTCAKDGDVNQLKEAIYKSLNLSKDSYEKPSLSNQRQISLLNSLKFELNSSIDAINAGCGVDVIAISLQTAYSKIKEILGEEVVVDLEDAIFSNFCVGK